MKNVCLLFPCLIVYIFAPMFFSANVNAQISEFKYVDSRNVISKKPFNIASLEGQVFAVINQKRDEYGLKPLAWNEQAAAVARLHSANMASFNFFSHTGIDGKHVDKRADSLGLNKWRMIGENIAYNSGFDDPVGRAVSGWLQSAGHRKNILRNEWKETGIGISVSVNGKFYITQVFLQRK